MNIISIIITQIPILGASALFAAGSVVMGIAKSKEVGAYDKMKIMVMERMMMMKMKTMVMMERMMMVMMIVCRCYWLGG